MDRHLVEESWIADPYDEFIVKRPKEAAKVERFIDEGRLLLEGGVPERARACFMKALAIFPIIPTALTNLAALSLHDGHPDQARHYLNKVMNYYPSDPAANGIAIRYWLQQGSYPQAYHHGTRAIAGLKRLLDKDGNLPDPTVVDRACVILLSTLTEFGADSLITEIDSLFPEREWEEHVHAILGIAHYNLGEFAKAQRAWEQ